MIDIYQYWNDPPPEPSPRLIPWIKKIQAGWKPNRRIRQMGYETRCDFFGVYLWEYWNVLIPLLRQQEKP